MKRAASLKIKTIALVALFATLTSMNASSAATYSISQLTGSAAYAPSLYGQTFLVPVGKSGTISGVTSLSVSILYGTTPSVVWAKIWNSPSKTSLIASSSNTYTTAYNAGGWTSTATFALNFNSFQVIGGTSYYLEVGRSSGSGSFYITEGSGNPYADGSIYHDGVIDTNYDLKFKIDITLGIAASAPILTIPTSASKGVLTSLSSVTSVAGSIAFKNNGKSIPSCQRVLAVGSPLTATCNWKPPVSGSSTISAILIPSDTSTYNNTPSVSGIVLVSRRANTR